jgi:hypothetical protein
MNRSKVDSNKNEYPDPSGWVGSGVGNATL